jgi:hypothetical protein
MFEKWTIVYAIYTQSLYKYRVYEDLQDQVLLYRDEELKRENWERYIKKHYSVVKKSDIDNTLWISSYYTDKSLAIACIERYMRYLETLKSILE